MRRALQSLLILLLTVHSLRAQEIRAREEITVERVIVDAYVVNAQGNPLPDLRPMNFRVAIDGLPAEVEAVEWVDATRPYPEGLPSEEVGDESAPAVPQGRLIVIFFQTDFQRARVGGQMKITPFALEFLDGLTGNDRVAVVSFDSHLKLRQDFTNDREKLERAIKASILIDHPARPPIGPSPSLVSRIKSEDAKSATSSEKALFLIGNALLPIPGPKTLVLFGWGLGRYGAGGVKMIPDYAIARRALEASRTSVFSLDVSEADYHSLEVGLGKVSADTGGFYAKTHIFPRFAIEKLQRVISGHYVLVLKKPPQLPRGLHGITVELKGAKGTVHARSSFQDR